MLLKDSLDLWIGQKKDDCEMGKRPFYDICAGAVASQKDYLEPLKVNIRNQTGIRGFLKAREAPV